MKITKTLGSISLLVMCFAVGLYGAPVIHSAYGRLFPAAAFRSGDFSSLRASAGNEVILFTTSSCPYCKKTRDLLEARNINYKDYVVDQSKEAEDLFEKRGGGGVPLIYIGDREIRGLQESAIVEALAALKISSASN